MNGPLYSRRDFIRVAGAAAGAGILGFPAVVRARPKTRATIVLGIDGFDPTLLTRFIREGRMPHARRLIERGAFSPLRTSDPPQSPVAWANFSSGTDPGGHGLFDFIARDPETLEPYLSCARIEGRPKSVRMGDWRIPLSARRLVNLRKGPAFWRTLQEHGVPATVIRLPSNFPPTECDATTLSGLGTPDIHGGYGTFTFYTDRKAERSRDVSGGRIERVRIREHQIRCTLRGPLNSLDAAGRTVDVPFTVFVDPVGPAARFSVQGHDFILQAGEWSDWITVTFHMLPHVVTVSGICRFFLKSARNDFQLYVSPVNIDPADPFLPISTPAGYSRRLAQQVGKFYTETMAQDTNALSTGIFDDNEYREQAGYVLDEERRLFAHAFNRFRDGFFFFYFSSLDLNCHTFWRTLDPAHPLYSAELARDQGDFIPWLYGKMDEVIGEALARVDDATTLIVMSDHGFGSFRRQFNLNSWLMDNGYAAAVRGARRGADDYFSAVDWTRTAAYGLGINSLYLNLEGREPGGRIAPGPEQERLTGELVTRLKAVRDPQTGEPVISNVYRPREIYSGPCVRDAPDLIVGYRPPYRASWDTVLGKYPREHVLDNTDPWSGDHALDSPFMSGVLLANRPIHAKRPALLDLAPSILSGHGVPVPAAMTGHGVLGPA